MADIQELIARLEAGELGPDLDASICVLLQYGGPNSNGATNVRSDGDWEGDLLFEQGDDECCNPIPAVTTSLDAALALAERSGLQGSDIMHKAWSMMAKKHALHCRPYTGESYARDAALQACIAILKAKAQGEGE